MSNETYDYPNKGQPTFDDTDGNEKPIDSSSLGRTSLTNEQMRQLLGMTLVNLIELLFRAVDDNVMDQLFDRTIKEFQDGITSK